MSYEYDHGDKKKTVDIYDDRTSVVMLNKQEQDVELIRRRNRRRQAWGAFMSMIGALCLQVFVVPDTRLPLLEESFIIFYIIMGGIVATYHGSSAYIAGRSK